MTARDAVVIGDTTQTTATGGSCQSPPFDTASPQGLSAGTVRHSPAIVRHVTDGRMCFFTCWDSTPGAVSGAGPDFTDTNALLRLDFSLMRA